MRKNLEFLESDQNPGGAGRDRERRREIQPCRLGEGMNINDEIGKYSDFTSVNAVTGSKSGQLQPKSHSVSCKPLFFAIFKDIYTESPKPLVVCPGTDPSTKEIAHESQFKSSEIAKYLLSGIIEFEA